MKRKCPSRNFYGDITGNISKYPTTGKQVNTVTISERKRKKWEQLDLDSWKSRTEKWWSNRTSTLHSYGAVLDGINLMVRKCFIQIQESINIMNKKRGREGVDKD